MLHRGYCTKPLLCTSLLNCTICLIQLYSDAVELLPLNACFLARWIPIEAFHLGGQREGRSLSLAMDCHSGIVGERMLFNFCQHIVRSPLWAQISASKTVIIFINYWSIRVNIFANLEQAISCLRGKKNDSVPLDTCGKRSSKPNLAGVRLSKGSVFGQIRAILSLHFLLHNRWFYTLTQLIKVVY